MQKNQIIGLIVVLAVIVGASWWLMQPPVALEEKNGDTMLPMQDEKNADGEEFMDAAGGTMLREDAEMMAAQSYRGEVLAGSLETSPLITFNESDYKKARASGKVVLLWFYANWCPTCQLELRDIKEAFNQFDKEGVVGFRVNYNDSDTDAVEKSLAREYGVAYQHTKVFIQADAQLMKTPETWGIDTYLEEFNKVTN